MVNKKEPKIVHLVAATVFAVIAFLHAIRLVYMLPVNISGWDVPFWLSFIALFISGSLAILLWKTSVD